MADELENAEWKYETVGSWDVNENRDDEVNDFEIAELDPKELSTLKTSVEYIRGWLVVRN